MKYHGGNLRMVNEKIKILDNEAFLARGLWGERKIIYRWMIIYQKNKSYEVLFISLTFVIHIHKSKGHLNCDK